MLYVGNRGRPPRLRRHIPKIIEAYRRNEARNELPRSIAGLWKADLFLGSNGADAWVGTTIKINPRNLEGAQGLRLGIYPKRNAHDAPRKDDKLNLVRLPLPYDGEFMEVFYKAFFLVRAFMRATAKMPTPVHLPDAEDRMICEQLERRRDFPVLDAADALSAMAQPDLIGASDVEDRPPDASLSEEGGLQSRKPGEQLLIPFGAVSESVSLAPLPTER